MDSGQGVPGAVHGAGDRSERILTSAQVGALLAQGSTCEVFDLADPGASPPGRRLVLKRILPAMAADEGFRQRLQGLSELLVKLRHPYAEEVVEVHASSQDRCYLICERLEGESLESLLHREGRLPLVLVRQIAHQIAEALSAAHALGIAHGNLSPRQIVLTRAGRPESPANLRVKVRGFGLAPPLGMGLYGTPSFLSPEQLRDFEPRLAATARSDQFSLAALLFQALEGRPLYPGERVDDVRVPIVRRDPKHFELLGVSSLEMARVDKALHKALSKDPHARFERLLDFIEAMDSRQPGSIIRQLAPPAAPPAAPRPVPAAAPESSGCLTSDVETLPFIRRPALRQPTSRRSALDVLPSPPSPRVAILMPLAAVFLALLVAFVIFAAEGRLKGPAATQLASARTAPPLSSQPEPPAREPEPKQEARPEMPAPLLPLPVQVPVAPTPPALPAPRELPVVERVSPREPETRAARATSRAVPASDTAAPAARPTAAGVPAARPTAGCHPEPRFKHSAFEAWFQKCLTPNVLRALRKTEFRVLQLKDGRLHVIGEHELPQEFRDCLDQPGVPSYQQTWRGYVVWTCR